MISAASLVPSHFKHKMVQVFSSHPWCKCSAKRHLCHPLNQPHNLTACGRRELLSALLCGFKSLWLKVRRFRVGARNDRLMISILNWRKCSAKRHLCRLTSPSLVQVFSEASLVPSRKPTPQPDSVRTQRAPVSIALRIQIFVA
jgi:hypothetical protein